MKNKLLFVIALFILCCLFFWFYQSMHYVTKYQLENIIGDTIAVHQSLSSPNRQYYIYYNKDKTFSMDTIEDGNKLGTTTGYYNVINKWNRGYIDINYTHIFESPYIQSTFNQKNKHNVYTTKKNLLGPFILYVQPNRSAFILEYETSYSVNKKYMTVYSQTE